MTPSSAVVRLHDHASSQPNNSLPEAVRNHTHTHTVPTAPPTRHTHTPTQCRQPLPLDTHTLPHHTPTHTVPTAPPTRHTHTPTPHTHTHTQCRQPLPLDTLRVESCPRISAHDLIILARLEPQTLGYSGNLTSDPIRDNPLMARGGARGTKKSRQRAVILDIRPIDEFRAGHVINSLNVPQETAFLADGSLSPSQTQLGRVPRGRVLVVVGSKGNTGPVVRTCTCSSTTQCALRGHNLCCGCPISPKNSCI